MSPALPHLAAALLAALLCAPVVQAGTDVTGLLWEARDYQDAGDHRAAVITLKNALQEAPDSAEARWLLGSSYLALGLGVRAVKEFRRAGEAGVAAATLVLPLAEALRLEEDWRGLLEATAPLPELAPADAARVLGLRGLAHLKLDERELAEVAFEEALALDESTVPARLGRARLVLADGEIDVARAHLEAVLPDARGSDAVLGWRMEAMLAARDGGSAAVEAALGHALEAASQDSRVALELRLQRAAVRLDLGDLEGARDDVAAPARRAPRHPTVLYLQGALALREGRLAEAREHLERALAVAPDHRGASYYLGAIKLVQGEAAAAEAHLERVVRAVPGHAMARRLLGIARLRLERPEEAAQALAPLAEGSIEDAGLASLLARVDLARGARREATAHLARAIDLQPDALRERVALGWTLMDLGEHEAGLAALEAAAERLPQALQGHWILLEGQLRAGDLAAARELAEAMVAEYAVRPEAWVALAQVELKAGDVVAAIAALGEALERRPGHPPLVLALAELEWHRGDAGRARKLYGALLTDEPENLAALMGLATVEAVTGNEDVAAELVGRARAAHPEALAPALRQAAMHLAAGEAFQAVALLREAESHHGEHPLLQWGLGEARLATGDIPQAVYSLSRAAAALPQRLGVHYALAKACADQGDAECLAQALGTVLELAPEHPAAWPLAERLLELTPSPEAVSARLDQLEAAAPDSLVTLDLRARQALAAGHAPEAVALYVRAREQAPEDGRWVRGLAGARAQTGELSVALAILDDWLRTHPADAASRYALARLHVATGDEARAREELRRVVAEAPDAVAALNDLAWLLREADPDAALGYVQRAVELAPRYDNLDTLGVVLLALDRPGEAADALRRALTLRPGVPGTRYQLARALSASGQTDGARDVLRRVVDAEETFPERPAAEALLQSLD